MAGSKAEQFSALYDSTQPLIHAYALRRSSSPEDAADVAAETYEIAWRRFDDVPSGRAALLWLYVTARYVLANQGRRRRKRESLVETLALELETALRVEPHDEDSVAMKSCLKELSADDREVLMLAGWEGLSATDIGRVLGCSPTAARIRLHRARTRLRVEMTGRSAETKRIGSAEHEQGETTDEARWSEEVLEQ